MNCAIVSENKDCVSKLKAALSEPSSKFTIGTELLPAEHTGSIDLSDCQVLFFSHDRNSLSFMKDVLQKSVDVVPILFAESGAEIISVCYSASVECFEVPHIPGSILLLERRLLDIFSLHERSPTFALSWRVAFDFLLRQQEKRSKQRCVLPDINGYREINTDSIMKLESEGSYTTVYFFNGDCLTTCKPLRHYEQVLNSPEFQILNNEYMVNTKSIVQWDRGAEIAAVLCDGSCIPISRRRVPLLYGLLNEDKT